MDVACRGKMLKVCNERELLKTDDISELSDDILVRILSSLTLKEAGRTSVLSKRWRHVWAVALSTTLSLKSPNFFGPNYF